MDWIPSIRVLIIIIVFTSERRVVVDTNEAQRIIIICEPFYGFRFRECNEQWLVRVEWSAKHAFRRGCVYIVKLLVQYPSRLTTINSVFARRKLDSILDSSILVDLIIKKNSRLSLIFFQFHNYKCMNRSCVICSTCYLFLLRCVNHVTDMVRRNAFRIT